MYHYTTQIKPIFNTFKIKFILNIKSYLKETEFYKLVLIITDLIILIRYISSFIKIS